MTGHRDDRWIWTVAELRGFTTHELPEVAVWAIDRLGLLAPETLTELLPDLAHSEEEMTLRAVLSHLERSTAALPEEALRLVTERWEPGRSERTRALALLAAAGDEAARAEIGPHADLVPASWDAWVARDAAGCREVLLELLEDRGPEAVAAQYPWLCAVARPSDVGRLLEVLHCDGAGGGLEPDDLALILLERAGVTTLHELEVFHPQEELDSFRAWRAEVVGAEGPSVALPLADSAELTAALEELDWGTFTGLALRACRDLVQDLPADEPREWSEALLAALEARDDVDQRDAEIAGALAAEMSRAALLGELSTALPLDALLRIRLEGPRSRAAQVEALIFERYADRDALAPGEEDAAAGVLRRALCDPDTEAEALALAGRLDGLALRDLSAAAVAEGGFGLAELLAGEPLRLRQVAEELLGRDEGSCAWLLQALTEQPHRWASRLVADRLDALLRQHLPGEVWGALEELGDPETLDEQRRNWHPGDTPASGCVAFVATLAGRTDELPSELVVEAREHWQRVRTLAHGLFNPDDDRDPLDSLRQDLLSLDLCCTACSRIHSYDSGEVCLHPEGGEALEGWDGVLLGRIITCKSCGAVDRYELTSRAHARLMVELLPVLAGEGMEASRVTIGVPRLFDGTLMTRPSQGIEHLHGLIGASPDDGERRRRLGNLYERVGLQEEAEQAWREAIEVDDAEAEAAYSLASAAWGRQEPGALEYVLQTISRLPQADLPDEMREGVAVEMVEYLEEAAPHITPPLALMMVWDDGVVGDQLAMRVSSVDLRRIRRWDRLTEMLTSTRVMSAAFIAELPEAGGQLEELLAGSMPIRGAAPGGHSGHGRGPIPAEKKEKRRAQAKAARKQRRANRPKRKLKKKRKKG